MYSSGPNTGNLTLNSTATNPTATIATGTEPFRVDFDPTGKFLYLTNEGSAASLLSSTPSKTTVP
jgi:DNA-binding beta-propeller fold protein YncE